MIKTKSLILLLILSSLFGYLEWGSGNQTFLFEAEYAIIQQIAAGSRQIIHPFVILPMLGQLLLLICLLPNPPGKRFIYFGISFLFLLLGFMFIIGVMARNFKILLSTLPFISISVYTLFHLRKKSGT